MERRYRITNYSEELLQCMYQLQQKGELCDTVLNCKDGAILIHSLVLLSCGCQHLKTYLSVENNQYSLKLQDFTTKTVCCLVQTIYTGEILLLAENISEFSRLCSVLGLEKAVQVMEEDSNDNREPDCSNVMLVDSTCEETSHSNDHDFVINEKTGLMEKRVCSESSQPLKKQKLDHTPTESLLIMTVEGESTGSEDMSHESTRDQTAACRQYNKAGDESKSIVYKSCEAQEESRRVQEEPKSVAESDKEKTKEDDATKKQPMKQEKEKKTQKKSAVITPKQKYQQEILKAYDAVISGKMTVREACKEYKIPDSTLRDRVKNRNAKKHRVGQSATFDKFQSQKLADLYCMLYKLGYNYPAENLCTLASQYAVSLDKRPHSKPITKHWFYIFCEGFPKVKEMRNQLQQMEKTGSYDAESFTSQFHSYLSSTMVKYDLIDKPENIFSFTTTEISYLPPYMVRKVPLVKESINLFICANAVGEVMPPYYVFPEASTDIDNLSEDCKPGKGVLVEEKLFPSEIFLNFLKTHFQEHSSIEEQRIILVDGHNMYVSVEVLEWAEDHKVSLVVIPSGNSEKHQPLELQCREPFEKMFIEYCEANENSELDRKSLCEAFSTAYSNVFTVYDIKSSFTDTEIYPFKL